ncbi:MAG: GatB/YqeY domain-containing protein [Thermodesulfobacteriota bacterium]|nr:GatB/YqeY domain-containing protein [Thermodesulfobacteriota bacterium]
MLLEKIRSDMKAAMKAGDKQRLTCLRMLITAIKNREVGARRTLEEQEIVSIIRSQIKQHKDSYTQFKEGNREDLAQIEKKEISILGEYLPKEMPDSEIKGIVDEVITEIGATRKDFGKVMKTVMARVAGKADGKKVNSIVSQCLNNQD